MWLRELFAEKFIEKFWKVGRRRCRHHCKALFSSEFSSYTVGLLSMFYSFKNLLETV